jgi:hypothetical protein
MTAIKTQRRYEERPNDGRSVCWNIHMIVSAWYPDENGYPTRFVYRKDDDVWSLPIPA